MFRNLCQRVISPITRGTFVRTFTEDGNRRFTPEKSVNKVTLIGRVGRDAMRIGMEERPVVVFPLATTEVFRTRNSDTDFGGDLNSKTTWHRVVCFQRGLGEIMVNQCTKGRRVYISGHLTNRTRVLSDGQRATFSDIAAEDVIFLGQRRQEADQFEETPLSAQDLTSEVADQEVTDPFQNTEEQEVLAENEVPK